MKSLMTSLFASLYALSLCANDYYPYRFEGVGEEYLHRPLDLISIFIPNDPIIFEAGGHYGVDTDRLSKKWPKGTVHSFEPNPNAFQKLSEVAAERENVNIYPLAVANFNGMSTFCVCYGTTGDNPVFEGASSLLPASEGMKIHYQGPQVEVECVVLDDWCKKNHVNKIDFMWLDLEGMELQTLQSSPEILSTVSAIYVETNFQEFRYGMTQYAALKGFLEASGFRQLSHWYNQGLQGNAIFIRGH